MEFFDVVNKRHSVRSFKNKEIEQEKIQKILEAVNSAPSAGNLQAYEIVLVKDKQTKAELVNAALGQSFIKEAPVVFVICANEKRSGHYGERGRSLYCINDASIAGAYMELSASALELASVWVGAFDENDVRKAIHAPEHVKPIAIIPVGYPDESPKRHSRRQISDIIHKEKF